MGKPEPLLDIYLQCFYYALNKKQTVGKEKYYYITIEQLQTLIDEYLQKNETKISSLHNI